MAAARVAIVTGAARGIGRAISLRLANDGLNVVANDIPSKAEELQKLVSDIRDKKRQSLAVFGDVSREADVQKLVSTAVSEMGALDVMIANAGIARSTPLTSTTVEEWDLLQAINVRGVFLCYKAAAVQMIKQARGGRIIGASSLAGKQGVAEWGPYCTSKFAVRGLTQAAAAEWGKHGITVNAYAPGIVETPLWKDVDESRNKHGLDEKGIKSYSEETIMTPDDVAALVAYLVRDEAKFVTGQSININAGMHFD